MVVSPEMRDDDLDERPITSEPLGDDARFDLTLRPRNFAEVVGQRALIDNLKIFVQAARGRKEPLDHVLFCGPRGLGKTSLAHVIAHELGAQIHVTSGPALERKGDLAGILTNLAENDVRSEEHRLNSSHQIISYAVFCLKKKKPTPTSTHITTRHTQDNSGLMHCQTC